MFMIQNTSGRHGYNDVARCKGVHRHVVCDGCGQNPLTGVRYRCSTCPDFDYCTSCMDKDDEGLMDHPSGHLFVRLSKPVVEGVKPAIFRDKSKWRHENVSCHECNTPTIIGFRYFCIVCAISFCESCDQGLLLKTMSTTSHDTCHNLMKMMPPDNSLVTDGGGYGDSK